MRKRYFVMTPDDQQFFSTQEEAMKYADSWIEEYRDPEEWDCDEGDIIVLYATHHNAITSENQGGCDYGMKEIR